MNKTLSEGRDLESIYHVAIYCLCGSCDLDRTEYKSQEKREFLLYSEMVRVKAEALLRLQPAQDGLAELAFMESIELNRGRSARFLELKSSLSLARLWTHQGKHDQAYSMLTNIYAQFTEGFDLTDLQEARKLLLQLES